MEIINKNGVKFHNVSSRPATGFSTLLTNVDNIRNNRYDYDSESDPIICALDINWGGAEVAPGIIINTTDELINWIKNIGMTINQQKALEECKNILTIVKDYILRNSNSDANIYWYCGPENINESTQPGSSTYWHLITDTPTQIETGEIVYEQRINWVIAVPTSIGLNHISNGTVDLTSVYDVTTVTCADGVEYKVFTQVNASKKTDIIIQ